MGDNNIKKISLPVYLKALAKLPGVTPENIQETRRILRQVFEDNYLKPVVFERGKKGDGIINVSQVYKAPGHKPVNIPVVFDASGAVYVDAQYFQARIPDTIAPYFVGGIFGMNELTFSDESDLDPSLKWKSREIVLKKIEGVRDIYRCAIRTGDIEACGESDALEMLEEAETMAAELKAENQKIQQRKAEEESEKEAEALRAQRDKEDSEASEKAQRLWKAAEEMREASRGPGALWGGYGDPDEIQAIMDKYPGGLDAKGSLMAMEMMMREIGESDGGSPQFEERFCTATFLGRTECGLHETGHIDHYSRSCEFGVQAREYYINSCESKKTESQTEHRRWLESLEDKKPCK